MFKPTCGPDGSFRPVSYGGSNASIWLPQFLWVKLNLSCKVTPSVTFSFFFFTFNARMLEEREEPGFLTGLKIPAPWAAGKTVETVHPVRDNYKFKETVHIPGARCLYLRFDSRCSSQYDYDKVSRGQTINSSLGGGL